MTIGKIYIYYSFNDLSQEIKGSSNDDWEIPEFARRDQFRFFLENIYFQRILDIQIGGIEGLTYLGVRSYEIKKAIHKQSIIMETNSKFRRIYIRFIPDEVMLWGIKEIMIRDFIVIKLGRFAPIGYDFAINYDNKTRILSFNSGGLVYLNLKTNESRLFSKQDIIDELDADSKIPIYSLLNWSTNEPVRISIGDKDAITIQFDKAKLNFLGFELSNIEFTLQSVFSVTTSMNAKESIILNSFDFF